MTEAYSHAVAEQLYVHYGCGTCAPEGWVNFDASLRLRLEQNPLTRPVVAWRFGTIFPNNVRYGDVVRGLPIPVGVAAGVYCSHVLEHLALDDVTAALAETYRILKPGGVFRMVVPDLFWRAKKYVESASEREASAADDFLQACLLGRQEKADGVVQHARLLLGNSSHLWMFDEASLRFRLEGAGFEHVRRCQFGDAVDPMFDLVEDRDRFFEAGEAELAIEARKSP